MDESRGGEASGQGRHPTMALPGETLVATPEIAVMAGWPASRLRAPTCSSTPRRVHPLRRRDPTC